MAGWGTNGGRQNGGLRSASGPKSGPPDPHSSSDEAGIAQPVPCALQTSRHLADRKSGWGGGFCAGGLAGRAGSAPTPGWRAEGRALW